MLVQTWVKIMKSILTSLFFSLILQIAFICLMDQNNLLPNIAFDICCKFIFISCKLLFYKSQINVSKCFLIHIYY